jgi:hypothetical protein
MVSFVARSSARRWVLPLLVLLLVLGHACELPAYADVVGTSQTAEESHPSNDGHHAGEQGLSCDAVSATSIPGHPRVAAALEISVMPQVNDPAPPRMVARTFEGPPKFAARPPLFLLHASFLI